MEWNLETQEFQTIKVYCIQLVSNAADLSDSPVSLRLLVLSHQLAHFGIPAFFLNKKPNIFVDGDSGPSIIAFDLDKRVDEFPFPYFFEKFLLEMNVSQNFPKEFMDYLQRGVTLYKYYKQYSYSPLYFTSYLLFPASKHFPEAFVQKYVPVLINGKLKFRVLVLGDLHLVNNNLGNLHRKSIILVPPYEHPFLVIESLKDKVKVKNVNHEILTFNRKDIKVSIVLNPSISLYMAFKKDHSKDEVISNPDKLGVFCQFKMVDQFSMPADKIKEFFQKKIEEDRKKKMSQHMFSSSSLETVPASLDTILTEQITNKDCISLFKAQTQLFSIIPLCSTDVKIKYIQDNTFFEICYGLTKFSRPKFSLSTYSNCNSQIIDLFPPKVSVRKNNMRYFVSAPDVINKWIPDGYIPLSGEKNANFIVFSAASISEKSVKHFFISLSNAYSQYGFGRLTPFRKFQAFVFTNSHDVERCIGNFLTLQPLSEFNQYPTVAFVINNKELKVNIQPHIYLSYIDPLQVQNGSPEICNKISFLVYSRIRSNMGDHFFETFQSNSLNSQMITNNMNNFVTNNSKNMNQPHNIAHGLNNQPNLNNYEYIDPNKIFFGYRYQPPFCLVREPGFEKSIHLIICWDIESYTSVWTDDIGSILTIEKVANITTFYQFLIQTSSTIGEGSTISMSILIFNEHTTPEIFQTFESIKNYNINVFTITPTPYVQIKPKSKNDAEHDYFIFSPSEKSYDTLYKFDILSCGFVLSKRFPSYYLTLLHTNSPQTQEVIQNVAKTLSNLSWTSVRPGSEKRINSYPPILNLLVQKISPPTRIVNNFEFLPFNIDVI